MIGEDEYQADDGYAQDDACREALFDFLGVWDESKVQRKAIAESTETITLAMDINYEPVMRVLANSRPPKLFYRTFWRSLTRRLMLKVV
jgi:hypothetical protein